MPPATVQGGVNDNGIFLVVFTVRAEMYVCVCM